MQREKNKGNVSLELIDPYILVPIAIGMRYETDL